MNAPLAVRNAQTKGRGAPRLWLATMENAAPMAAANPLEKTMPSKARTTTGAAVLASQVAGGDASVMAGGFGDISHEYPAHPGRVLRGQ